MDSLTFEAQQCPNCNQATDTIQVGQSFPANKLVWYISQLCSNCGFASEEDNSGEIVEPWRSHLLEKYGVWCVFIDRKNASSRTMKALRDVLQLTIQQLVGWKRGETSYVRCGTHTEAAYLQEELAYKGIKASIERSP